MLKIHPPNTYQLHWFTFNLMLTYYKVQEILRLRSVLQMSVLVFAKLTWNTSKTQVTFNFSFNTLDVNTWCMSLSLLLWYTTYISFMWHRLLSLPVWGSVCGLMTYITMFHMESYRVYVMHTLAGRISTALLLYDAWPKCLPLNAGRKTRKLQLPVLRS